MPTNFLPLTKRSLGPELKPKADKVSPGRLEIKSVVKDRLGLNKISAEIDAKAREYMKLWHVPNEQAVRTVIHMNPALMDFYFSGDVSMSLRLC